MTKEDEFKILKIVVTGEAGFIGSRMVRNLNEHGINDIIIVDHIVAADK